MSSIWYIIWLLLLLLLSQSCGIVVFCHALYNKSSLNGTHVILSALPLDSPSVSDVKDPRGRPLMVVTAIVLMQGHTCA